MTTKRVLVTGASGFIGRPLVTALLRAGYTVRAATRHTVSFPNTVDVALIPDFINSVDWNPILRDVDIVVHTAGLAHVGNEYSSFGTHDQINRITTQELASAAKNMRLERFVFISSVRAQVGPSAKDKIREQDAPAPTDDYGRSKLAAEIAIRSIGIPCTVLRPVVVYGPHSKGNIRRLIQLASLPLLLPFKGFTGQRSILGIDNLIAAILFVLNNQTTVGEDFLVADPEPLSLPRILAILRKAQGRPPGLIYFPPPLIKLALLLSGQIRHWERLNENLIVDTSKFESFGWRPAVKTEDGLRSAISNDNDERR